MRNKAKKILPKLVIVAIFATAVVIPSADAQEQPRSQEEKTILQQQLQDIENQIQAYQRELSQIKGEKNTLQNKIKQLQKQQTALQLRIKATTLQIEDTGKKLNATQEAIEAKTATAEELKKHLAELIRLTNEQDNIPLWYAVISQDNLSDALSQLTYYSLLSERLQSVLKETKQITAKLGQDEQRLAEQREEAQNLLAIQSLQKEQLSDSVGEHDVLLQKTRGLESEYQNVLSDSQKKAAEIRNRLYELFGVTTQITFGQAVEIAKWASAQTSVRAAFLLAILTQESNLGKNVGTCNRPGDPPEKSWKVVMKPDRDQQPFLQVTAELGLDPDTTPVSCPMKDKNGKQIGWGGAMGPAQFIPSTWMGYKDKVAAITGKSANPWDIRDAFLASGLKLAAGGATSVEGEWAAAMRYFSGGTNPRFRFYGDNVVAMANRYLVDIEELNK